MREATEWAAKWLSFILLASNSRAVSMFDGLHKANSGLFKFALLQALFRK